MRPKLGVQLFTLRSEIRNYEDTEATFKFLRDIGCDVIQISAIGPLTPAQKAELVKKYDMDVCLTHTDYFRMVEETDAVIDEHKLIGCDCLGIGMMPAGSSDDLESLREFIAEATAVSERMKERGCRFAYHNHSLEYEKIDGERTIMDVLIKESDFLFVPDIAWMQIAGADPAEELKKMKGRVKVVHFKDYAVDEDGDFYFTEIGAGVMELDRIYEVCRELEIPYIVYEQDSGFDDPFVATENSFKEMVKRYGKN